MNKKCVFIILTFCLYLSGNLIFSNDIDSTMLLTYNEIVELNPRWGILDISKYDAGIWLLKKVLVLKYPLGIEKIDGNNNSNGEYRYLGYNVYGDLVNNPDYPDDHPGKEIINTYHWVVNYDKRYGLSPYISTIEDLNFYKKEIFYFLENEYGSRFDEDDDPMLWLERANVIVPVSEYGRGVIRYEHMWDSDKDGNEEKWYITVNLRSKREATDWRLTIEDAKETPIVYRSENIDANVDLRSNLPEKELFDADVAIPTGEKLYANIRVKEYINSVEYLKNEGTVEYDVIVSKNYMLRRWDDDAIKIDANNDGDYLDIGDRIEGDWVYDGPYSVVKTYPITRSYCYYTVNKIGVYTLAKASINNLALPGGVLELLCETESPKIELKTYSFDDHVLPLLPTFEKYIELGTETIGSGTSYPSVPDENFQGIANASLGEFLVRNDKLTFNGVEILNDSLTDTEGEKPINIPEAPLCAKEKLYKTDIVIPDTIPNGKYQTTGSVEYEAVPVNVSGEVADYYIDNNKYTVSLRNLEQVSVHTPVVCEPKLNAISKMSQKVLQDKSAFQLVLEETFHLDYFTLGTHINAKGYGTRDYNPYTMMRQVQFPFDVYVGNGYSGTFLPKNTWGTFNSLERTFFIPSWVKQKEGHILFRTVPKNIPTLEDIHYEFHANLTQTNYKAVEALPYEISSKVGSFKITDCRDDSWMKKFESISAGQNSTLQSILPIIPGIEYKDDANKISKLKGVMLGYPISFSLRTNGELNGQNDFVYISPKFSYVPEVNGKIDMNLRQEVDLYMNSYNSMEKLEKSFVLSSNQRTLIGESNRSVPGISVEDKKNSVQLWSGKFFLPNMTYCVPKGTDLKTIKNLDVNKAPFLRNGYIIVNFDIYVYNDLNSITKEIMMDSNKLDTFLKHNVPLDSRIKSGISEYLAFGEGWKEDGYLKIQLGLELDYGDILFYSTELRASQTYY